VEPEKTAAKKQGFFLYSIFSCCLHKQSTPLKLLSVYAQTQCIRGVICYIDILFFLHFVSSERVQYNSPEPEFVNVCGAQESGSKE
jgi:hypothetical protein